MRTIDATPTWEGLMPALLAVIENGTPEGAANAQAELMRIARALDRRIADDKAEEAARDGSRFRAILWTQDQHGNPLTVWIEEGAAQDVAAYAASGSHPASTNGQAFGNKLTERQARAAGAGWPDRLTYRR